MMQEPVKVCPRCHAEYAAGALMCADCGGALEFRTGEHGDIAPLPEEDGTVLVREDRQGYLEGLAAQLADGGIRSAIVPHPCPPGSCGQGPRFGLYVSEKDAAVAREVDRKRWLRDAPAEAESFEYREQELSGVCPACSTPVPEGRADCPECGLVVNPEADVVVCPDCEAEVGDEVSRCPHCGAEFEAD